MKDLDVLKQSKSAYAQWAKQWRAQAKHHSRFAMKDMLMFQNIGIGRACLVIANGYSFEKNIETIIKYRDNVDVLCVDKCLVHCLDHGIAPDYVLICDANVSYKKYLEPVRDRLGKTTAIMNVCANPEWSGNGNWKDIVFFVNQDVLKSEREFQALSGCPNLIPAGTNVSNAAVIALNQSGNEGRKNFFGYDKLLLIGFDYSWGDDSYYAFDRTGGGKKNYMKTVYCFDQNKPANQVYTSTNLLFSAKWLEKYVKTFDIKAVQCSRDSIFHGWRLGDLAEQMQYRYRPEDARKVLDLLEYRRELEAKQAELNRQILAIGRDHYKQLIRTV